MVRLQTQSESEVLFHHNMKVLAQAVELLIAQNSKELHYYKNYDFTKRYTIALDEKTIPDYNAPVYVIRGHTRIINEQGRRVTYYVFDFYHFEHGYLQKDFDEMGSQYAECRLISGKEIQEKKDVNVLATDLARGIYKYRKGLGKKI